MEQNEFINRIKDIAIDVQAQYGIYASISISQAILESGWGTSTLAQKHNNLYGIKALRDWNGPVAWVDTKEYKNNAIITETQPFRIYKSWRESMEDHAFFLKKEWYIEAGIFESANYLEQIKAIVSGGYCSAPGYVEKIQTIIEKYNLGKFDEQKGNDNMKIAVRGGHNFKATGANGLISETVEDRKVKDAVIKYLKENGVEVLDVTPGNIDRNSDLRYGVSKANEWGADLFISIHFNNAYKEYNGSIGTESWTNLNNSKGKAIAQRITNNLSYLGFKNRGVKDGLNKSLYEIKHTKMAAIIVEVCFVEATGDIEIYNKTGVDTIGKIIAESIFNTPINSSSNNTIDGKWGVSAVNGLRIRSSMDISSLDNVVGKLHKGYKIKLFRKINNWYEIYYGDHGAYVAANYIKLI